MVPNQISLVTPDGRQVVFPTSSLARHENTTLDVIFFEFNLPGEYIPLMNGESESFYKLLVHHYESDITFTHYIYVK